MVHSNAEAPVRSKLVEYTPAEKAHRSAARMGIVQVMSVRVLNVLVSLVSFIIYSRLLSPKQFGLMAMTNTVFALVNIFRDFGLAQSAIQRNTLDDHERSELFWLNAVATIIGVVVLLVAAPLTAYFYGEEEVQILLIVSAITFFIWGIQSQHAAILRRNMRFWPVVSAEATGLVAGLAIGVIVAVNRRDVWALVAANLVHAVVTAGLMVAADSWVPHRPRNIFRSAKALAWARDLAVFNLLNYLTSNLGQILVGFQFGALELGRLNRAQQLYVFPNNLLLAPLHEIMFPLLSRVQTQHDAFRQYYLTLLRQTTLVFFVIGCVLPIISHDLVAFLLGPSWGATADILVWFSPAFIAPGLSTPAGLALTSQGRVAELRNWSILDFVLRAIGAVGGLPFGGLGVIAGSSLTMLFCSTPAILFILGRRGAVNVADHLKVAAPSLIVGVLAAAGAYVGQKMGEALFVPTIARLALECAGAALASGIAAMSLPQTRHIVFATARFIIFKTREA
jgi:PST family polysaccharide transporter